MFHQIIAAFRRFALGIEHAEGICCCLDLFRGAGQANQARVKIGNEFRDCRLGIAFWIDRDEDRLDLRAQFGFRLFELAQTLGHALDIGRADIRAISKAEIDDPVLAVEIGPAHGFAVCTGQFERPADGGAVQRGFFQWQRGVRTATCKRKSESSDCCGTDIFESVGHSVQVHALLTVGEQEATLPRNEIIGDGTLAKAVFRNAFLAPVMMLGLLFTGIVAVPVAAQYFSTGYEFLKAVKDRDGTEVTKVLEETNGAVVNARDKSTGETAMHIVAQRRDQLWIRFLAEQGTNPNIADKNGVTPLQISTNLGHIEGVEALLKAGANVDVANSTGETPLISAILRRDVMMTRLLLASGANPDRSDNSGRTAREYAKLDGNTRVLSEIERSDEERKGKKPQTSYGPSF